MPVMNGYEFLAICAGCPARRARGGAPPPETTSRTSRGRLRRRANEVTEVVEPFDEDIVTAKFRKSGLIW